jgi:hypothetical protein
MSKFGEEYQNDFYSQVSLKAETAGCEWDLVFSTEDESDKLTLMISVKAAAGPITVPFDPAVTDLHFTVGQQI